MPMDDLYTWTHGRSIAKNGEEERKGREKTLEVKCPSPPLPPFVGSRGILLTSCFFHVTEPGRLARASEGMTQRYRRWEAAPAVLSGEVSTRHTVKVQCGHVPYANLCYSWCSFCADWPRRTAEIERASSLRL